MINSIFLNLFKQARVIFPLALLFSHFSLSQDFQSLKILNSPYDEKHPVIDPDGSLFFSVGFHPDNIGGFKDLGDIWVSQPNSKGGWSKPTRVNALSTEGNDVVVGFPDPITVIVYHSEGAFGKGLHQYRRFGKTWNYLRPLSMDGFRPEGSYFSGRLDQTKTIMLLSFQQSDGFGNEDIYVSQLLSEGVWSSPVNLGAVINSFAQEQGPFLSDNQKYIFFSSNKSSNAGRGKDIYFSQRLDDSWTEWSTPQPLSLASTQGSDLYYMPLIQNQAIFSTTQNSEGFGDFVLVALEDNQDLFLVDDSKSESIASIEQPVELMEEAISSVEEVKEDLKEIPESDQKLGLLISEDESPIIQVFDLKERNSLVYQLTLIGKRGEKYVIEDPSLVDSLLSDSQWETIFIQSSGYIPREVAVESWESLGDYTFYLSKAEAGNSLVLNNIQFNVGTSDFADSRSIQVLDNLVEFLKENPTLKIRFEGHTDNYGDPMLNKELSLKRASKIRAYLTLHGIDFERIRISGWGGTRPIADNTTEEGRNLNRRVEMLIEK